MKTLLLGTDLTYNKNAELLPIEINTNIAMDNITIEDSNDIFNLLPLRTFILNNSFNRVTYIGGLHLFNDKLSRLMSELGVSYEFIELSGNSVIPEIEDTATHLIIRSAYDYNAIVDTTYCANKINFSNLIKNEPFGSKFAYLDESNILISNITSIVDNGNHPNFILKASLPAYDKTIYPKLFKVTNQAELDVVLQQISNGYFLMEYHINDSMLYDGLHTITRSFNLLVPPNLENLTLGGYKRFGTKRVDGFNTYDTNTCELSINDREKYLTGYPGIYSPKIGVTDLIEMSDGTFKTGVDLQVGDLVKTIVIPNPDNVSLDNDTASYNINYDTFVNETTFTSNAILNKIRIDKLTRFIRIILDDNTFWGDTQSSNYLILRDGVVRFISLNPDLDVDGLIEGDTIILIDTSQSTFTPILKTVIAIVTHVEVFSGYQIGVDINRTFLSRDPVNELTYMSIEHNVFCTPVCAGCGCSPQCSKAEECYRNSCTPCA